jgi:hypothetical protein
MYAILVFAYWLELACSVSNHAADASLIMPVFVRTVSNINDE